jgi:hypothetical protein
VTPEGCRRRPTITHSSVAGRGSRRWRPSGPARRPRERQGLGGVLCRRRCGPRSPGARRRGRLEQLQRLVAHALVALVSPIPSWCDRERWHVLEHVQHAQRAAQHRGDICCRVECRERCRRAVDAHQQVAQPEPVRLPVPFGDHQHRHAGLLQHPRARRSQGQRRVAAHAPAPDHQERGAFSYRGGQEDVDGVAIAHLDAMGARRPQQARTPGVIDEAAQCRAPRTG